MNSKDNKNLLVVISSPSGGGKDSIIRKLLKIIPNSVKLATTTTREPRYKEIDGVSYNFTNLENFKKLIDNNKLIEYNQYADNFYGIEKNKLISALEKYNVIFLQIDVNGKENLDKLGYKHLSFFLIPESIEILKNRIIKRKNISTKTLEQRLNLATTELKKSDLYKYKIINKDNKLNDAVKEIAKIILNNLHI